MREVKLAKLLGERLLRPLIEYQQMLQEAMDDAKREIMGDATIFDLDLNQFFDAFIEETRKISPEVDAEMMREMARSILQAFGRPASGDANPTPQKPQAVAGGTHSVAYSRDLPIATPQFKGDFDPNALTRAELETRARWIFEKCLVQCAGRVLDVDIQDAVTSAHKLTAAALRFDPRVFCRQYKPELYKNDPSGT